MTFARALELLISGGNIHIHNLNFNTCTFHALERTCTCIRVSVDSLCRDGTDVPIT